MNKELGIIKKLDIRQVWKNETNDFTPWLVEEENIERLSQAIGIELEVENTEVPVGPYYAYILARNTMTEQYVVIENYLDKINHDHLGKAITYAAVLDAKAVVWIAREFTEEHKKAIDWLNNNSTEDISYFGVVLELWQIDDSKPAVQFNVISSSSQTFKKSTITKSKKDLSEVKLLQLDFWTDFRNKLAGTKMIPSVGSPGARYWYNVPLGRSGIHLSNFTNTFDNVIGIRVYMSHRYNAKVALQQLLEQQDDIEKEIREKLLWDPNPTALDKTIVLRKKANI